MLKCRKFLFTLLLIVSIVLVGCEKIDTNPMVLTVLIPPYTNTAPIEKAAKIFESKYKDINLLIDVVEDDDHATKLSSEIMAGKGPDIIYNVLYAFAKEDGVSDINKLTATNAFENLSTLICSIDNSSDYYEAVLNATATDNNLYFLPITFNPVYLLATQTSLEYFGLEDIKNNSTMLNIMKKVTTSECKGKDSGLSFFMLYPDYSGISPLNYATQTTDFSAEYWIDAAYAFKQISQQYKIDPDQELPSVNDILELEAPFIPYTWRTGRDLIADAKLLSNEEEILLIPVRGSDGKPIATIDIAMAINHNSKNKEMAFEFLKIMMSPDIQDIDSLLNSISINRISIESRFQAAQTTMSGANGFPSMPVGFTNAYLSTIDEIGHIIISPYQSQEMYKHLEPFFEGERSYESCMQDLVNYYSIYLSE